MKRPKNLPFLVVILVLGGLGCDQLLEVKLPTRVAASTLNNPSLAPLLVQSAVAAFDCAFAHYAGAVALLTDEMVSATTGQIDGLDRRALGPGGPWSTVGCQSNTGFNYGTYTPLSIARFEADDAFRRIDSFADTAVVGKVSLLATAAAYAGYSYALFGEGFCEAAFDLGPAWKPPQILAKAEQRFTTAIDSALKAGNADILNMALVGRARVRLDLGKKAEAAADAKLVPKNFVKNATRSAANTVRENPIYSRNYVSNVVSVDPRFRNLTVSGVPDPRVRLVDAGKRGRDGVTPLWYQTKYTSESSPMRIATWNEAQLIIAEAEGGQSAVDRINDLRSLALLPLFNSSDQDSIMQQVREERRRALFLEGHRLNDMLRFGLPFDTGVDLSGARYGTTTCIPLPNVERDNNPNIGR